MGNVVDYSTWSVDLLHLDVQSQMYKYFGKSLHLYSMLPVFYLALNVLLQKLTTREHVYSNALTTLVHVPWTMVYLVSQRPGHGTITSH